MVRGADYQKRSQEPSPSINKDHLHYSPVGTHSHALEGIATIVRIDTFTSYLDSEAARRNFLKGKEKKKAVPGIWSLFRSLEVVIPYLSIALNIVLHACVLLSIQLTLFTLQAQYFGYNRHQCFLLEFI